MPGFLLPSICPSTLVWSSKARQSLNTEHWLLSNNPVVINAFFLVDEHSLSMLGWYNGWVQETTHTPPVSIANRHLAQGRLCVCCQGHPNTAHGPEEGHRVMPTLGSGHPISCLMDVLHEWYPPPPPLPPWYCHNVISPQFNLTYLDT